MVGTSATGGGPSFGAVPEDIVPDIHNTYNLGSSAKQWAALFVVLAMVTSLTIGGVIKLTASGTTLIVNESAEIQGNLNVSNNITALNITAKEFFLGDGSKLSGVTAAPANIFDQTLNKSDNVTFFNVTGQNISALKFFVGDGSFLTGVTAAPGNPFDQVLNISSNVTFFNVTTTGNVSAGQFFLGNGSYLTDLDSTNLVDGGTISFDWVDGEIADTLTIDASSTVADGALSSNICLLDTAQTFTARRTFTGGLNSSEWTNATITESQISDLSHTTDRTNTTEEMQDAVGEAFGATISYNDAGNLINLVDDYVNESGDTMTGNLNVSVNNVTTINCLLFSGGGRICKV